MTSVVLINGARMVVLNLHITEIPLLVNIDRKGYAIVEFKVSYMNSERRIRARTVDLQASFPDLVPSRDTIVPNESCPPPPVGSNVPSKE